MNDVVSKVRKGMIDNIEISFTVSASLTGQHVCAAEGKISSPSDAHQVFSGATKTLVDLVSQNKYSIIIAPDRFSFMTGYENVDALL